MRLVIKVIAIALVLAVLFAVGFALWGDAFERVFNEHRCSEWFAQSKPYAWAMGIGLLIGDLVLPVPATGIMAALGSVYGIFLGGVISVIGSAGAGLAGYGLARWVGYRATRVIASEEEILRFQVFFNHWGGAAIIVSRMMPILPEVVSILAGIGRMSPVRFVTALLLGTVPTAFFFAYLGFSLREEPWYGAILAVVIPLAIWPVFLRYCMGKNNAASNSDGRSVTASRD